MKSIQFTVIGYIWIKLSLTDPHNDHYIHTWRPQVRPSVCDYVMYVPYVCSSSLYQNQEEEIFSLLVVRRTDNSCFVTSNNSQVSSDNGKTSSPCLAACEDQVNLVTETSSTFPNSETFHRRAEFCLVVRKLLKTCATKKVIKTCEFNDPRGPM